MMKEYSEKEWVEIQEELQQEEELRVIAGKSAKALETLTRGE